MRRVHSFFGILIGWLINSSSVCNVNAISDRTIHPWIGILRVTSDRYGAEGATALVMVQKHLTVGNAHDVAKVNINTLRTQATAMFYWKHGWRNLSVSDYILHPEYLKGVLNTLALVYLTTYAEDEHSSPIGWPVIAPSEEQDVFSIELTDRSRRLQQKTNKMEKVLDSDCEEFFNKEKLNYQSLQPSNSVCYKVVNSRRKCIIDAGMPLTIRTPHSWKLIGISTYGPGCSLPSRYIQFLPYIPWVKSHSRPVRAQQKGENYRRTEVAEGLAHLVEDADAFLFMQLNNYSIIMKPSLAHVKENVFGACDGEVIYRELGTIRTPTRTATGVYSISLFDLFFPNISCVMLTVKCDKRSHTTYWVDDGFQVTEMGLFVKTVPVPKRNVTEFPKIMYVKNSYQRYLNYKTANLMFKFEYTDEAKIDLEFYGKKESKARIPMNTLPDIATNQTESGKFDFGAQLNARVKSEEEEEEKDSFYNF